MFQQIFHHDNYMFIHLYTDIDSLHGTRLVFGKSPFMVVQNLPHKLECENDIIKLEFVIVYVIAGIQS